ncbi:hypothetical protein JKP88DRAFT_350397 [Tribonema minus]|uniref:Uncharacterized protein n=1 Tax=Tribonema minus TaxID=303371 RepID=A0A835YR37_9STRA|nr:hypothetical protein JKP88DRAFT_350397 [Tribonema minus]
MVTALEEGGLREAADAVYADATARGALPDSVLDSDWEFDVSALPPAVARLKVRAVLRGVLAAARSSGGGGAAPAAEDLVFVCGTGVQRSVRGAHERRFDMRSYLSAVLATEYTPPLAAHTPPMQAGCIAVPRERVAAWIAAHIDGPHVGSGGAAAAPAAAAAPSGPAATAAASRAVVRLCCAAAGAKLEGTPRCVDARACVPRGQGTKGTTVPASAAALLLSNQLTAERALADEPDFETELPPLVTKALARYVPLVSFAGDYYLFEMKSAVENPENWSVLQEQVKMPATGRVAAVSRMERDFYGPMRSLASALDDFGGEDLVAATVKLEAAMAALAVETAGRSQRGGGTTAAQEQRARQLWEDGRSALNSYASSLNRIWQQGGGRGDVLAAVAAEPAGDASSARRRYIAYKKELAKCQQGGLGVNVCQNLLERYTAGGGAP